MSRVALISLLALVVALSGCASPGNDTAIATDNTEVEVLAALTRFNAVSGRGDLEGFIAQFDDSAEILLVGSDKGEVFKGRAAMAAWLQTMYKANGFSWEMDRVEISHHENTAWLFAEGRMVVRAKQTGQVRLSAPYRFSGVLIKKDDRWVWRLFHGSSPGPE